VQKRKLSKNQKKFRTQIMPNIFLLFFIGANYLEVNRHKPAFTVNFISWHTRCTNLAAKIILKPKHTTGNSNDETIC